MIMPTANSRLLEFAQESGQYPLIGILVVGWLKRRWSVFPLLISADSVADKLVHFNLQDPQQGV